MLPIEVTRPDCVEEFEADPLAVGLPIASGQDSGLCNLCADVPPFGDQHRKIEVDVPIFNDIISP